MSTDDAPAIACSLESGALPDRLDGWRRVLAHATARTPIDGGIRVGFAPTVAMAELAELVVAEHDCCGFFSFALTADGRGVALEVRAPAAGMSALQALFGTA